ncbi:peptidoglycan DD-metalloendopeptidase family protein [Cellulomonas sp. H30R-01]|uniref:M23 family metallopeptidase n=1 Tax=Cellulomonas sp. H30R-01 TaxID=2704467 RepID=UPI00138D4548|nr:M23 family metallopeptidase [Cellulomonas sp. H30R-01]QHT55391.1 peptidoglycan DD-metalloendopeptidase family protein [Cellulomonas sp. H30R-01]
MSTGTDRSQGKSSRRRAVPRPAPLRPVHSPEPGRTLPLSPREPGRGGPAPRHARHVTSIPFPRRRVPRRPTHRGTSSGRRARPRAHVVSTAVALGAVTTLLSASAPPAPESGHRLSAATDTSARAAGGDVARHALDRRAAVRTARTVGGAGDRASHDAGRTSGPGAPDVRRPAARYVWPLAPPVAVTAPFEAPPAPWAAGHRGVDLRATPGTAVRAPAPGVVTFVGVVAGRGVVSVAHGDGLRSSVEPVSSVVEVGARVAAGDTVGTVSPDGGHCAATACLHWGVRRGDVYLDPVALVDGGPIVLLPMP